MPADRSEARKNRPPAPEADAAAEPQLSATHRVSTDVSSVAIRAGMVSAGSATGTLPLTPAEYAAMDDVGVMLRVQAGGDAAFDHLVEKFRRAIIAFMYRMAHNQAVAEELAQEAFLRVYRPRQKY